jgi:hypothetical protein
MSRMHQDIKWIVVLAQFFGLFPVRNAGSDNFQDMMFTWRSKRAVLSLTVIVGSSFTMVMSFYRMCNVGYTLHRLGK